MTVDRQPQQWGLRALVRAHPIGSFWALACAFSWAWWLPMAFTGARPVPGVAWPTHLPGLLGPALAAVVVTALVDGTTGLARLRDAALRWRVPPWCWAVVAATLALAPAVALVGAALGRPLPEPGAFALYTGIGPVGIVGVVVIALVVNGFGEETGWRGFAAERLLRTHGLTRTAVVVAGMWGVWHLPLFWVLPAFRALGPVGTVGWAVGLLAGSVVLTALLRGSGGSVLLVAAWHTSFNLGSATEATQGLPAAVISTLVMAAAVVVVVRERRARHQPSRSRQSTS